MINQNTTLNMVIGYPLAHTKSPALHNAAYQALDLNATFLAFSHKELEPLIQVIKTLDVQLTAVTMPFKEQLLNHMDHLGPEVDALKAANTIIQREGKLWGYNTDVDGIEYTFRNTPLRDQHVLVLGAGGAACSLGYVLQKQQARVLWYNRTPSKAQRLAERFGGKVIEQAAIARTPIDIIANTTPVGMYPETDASPLPHYHFTPNQTVFDMIYNPLQTQLLSQAAQAGAATLSGIDMFIGQGLRQIELWQDRAIRTPAMIETLKQILLN